MEQGCQIMGLLTHQTGASSEHVSFHLAFTLVSVIQFPLITLLTVSSTCVNISHILNTHVFPLHKIEGIK